MTPAEAFALAVEVVLDIEGGALTRDNNGALVRWGINQAANPDIEVNTLTRAGAQAIYYARYWLALRCPELPPAVAVQVFDAAVNQGTAGATKILQLACSVTADGIIGPETIAAAQRLGGPLGAVEICSRRIQRYSDLLQWREYRRTWLDRALRFLLLARQISDGGDPPRPGA